MVDTYVFDYNNELGIFMKRMAYTRATDAMKRHKTFNLHQDTFQKSHVYGCYLNKYLELRRNHARATG